MTVNSIDLRLTDGGNTCTDTQKVTIDDKGSVSTYTCSQNTNFEPSSLHTSSKNYITIQLDNPDAINEGQLWLWFEGIVFTLTRKDSLPWQILHSLYVYIQSLTTTSGSRLFGSVVRALDFYPADRVRIQRQAGFFFQLWFIPLLQFSCLKMGARPG